MSLVPVATRVAALAAATMLSVTTVAQETTSYEKDLAPFFASYCVKCHGPDKAKADVTLHDLDAGLAEGRDLERWELVLEMLREGDMPPNDETQPSDADRSEVVAWIDEALRRGVAGSESAAVEPTTRRLTNFEFHNTLRDLLGVELDVARELPEDPSRPYTFYNQARFMLMGLEQIDRYLDAARGAMAAAIVDPDPPEVVRTRSVWSVREQRYMPDPTAMQRDELGIFGNRNRTVANGMRVNEWVDHAAFRVRVQASAILPEGYESVPLDMRMGYDIRGVGVGGNNPSVSLGIVELSNDVDSPQVFEWVGRIEDIPRHPEHRYRRGGKRTGRLVIIPEHYTITPVNVFDDGTLNDAPDPLTRPRVVVDWIEFESPIVEPWPPEHHVRILFESPLRESDPDAYLRQVLERFLTRAFRRPVSDDEVDRYTKVYAIVSEQQGLTTMEAALRETLATALVSPDFLYHTVAIEDAHRHYETASRLSYFLWGSMPDAELFGLAAQGRLDDPEVLAAQAERMLADRRSRDFVESFTSQWLSLDKMRTVPIDLNRFPRFLYTIQRGEQRGREMPNRPTIRDWMHEETVTFVAEMIRRNASVLNVVDSDFAMLNQPLAAHYGVAGVQGNELRPVPLTDDSPLGGVLTQGSVLVGTSTGAAPHPVYRAVWLREAILGDHVPDPPADVPALEDSVGEKVASEATSLKALLALHRTKESCNDCHARLDPWGIPFEEYDATGRFRPRVPPAGTRVLPFDKKKHATVADYEAYLTSIATVAVEADAVVPGGPEITGMEELKRYLLEARAESVARNVVRRLLTYALGRELTPRDHSVVEELLSESAANGHKLRDLIVAVCRTELFRGAGSAVEPQGARK